MPREKIVLKNVRLSFPDVVEPRRHPKKRDDDTMTFTVDIESYDPEDLHAFFWGTQHPRRKSLADYAAEMHVDRDSSPCSRQYVGRGPAIAARLAAQRAMIDRAYSLALNSHYGKFAMPDIDKTTYGVASAIHSAGPFATEAKPAIPPFVEPPRPDAEPQVEPDTPSAAALRPLLADRQRVRRNATDRIDTCDRDIEDCENEIADNQRRIETLKVEREHKRAIADKATTEIERIEDDIRILNGGAVSVHRADANDDPLLDER